MEGVTLLQAASSTLINLAFSSLVGALATRCMLRGGGARRVDAALPSLARVERAASMAGLAASAASMWAAAAAMGGVTLGEAGAMVAPMLGTAYGHGALAGFGALALLAALLATGLRSGLVLTLEVLFLVVLSLARVSGSHAAENGLLSIGALIEWGHLVMVALWVGLVGVSGLLVLPRIDTAWPGTAPLRHYLDRVSSCAAVALGVIVASGIYNAWHRVGSFEHLAGNLYGNALLLKVALVLAAAALGGYNKLAGFPSLAVSLSARARVEWVLRVECVLLAGALVVAGILTSTQPPASWS
jgi:putative copper resistance protein D